MSAHSRQVAMKRRFSVGPGSHKGGPAFKHRRVAPTAARAAIAVMRTIESKSVQTNISLASTTVAIDAAAGHIITIVEVSQGPASNQRIGRRMTLTQARFNGILTTQTTVNQAAFARLIIYIDHQHNSSATFPPIRQLLDTQRQDGPGVPSNLFKQELGFLNLANQERFQILKDKKFMLNKMVQDQAGNFGLPVSRFFKWSHHFKKPCVIDFEGATGAPGEIKSKNIGMVLLMNDGAPGNAEEFTELEGVMRIRFQG